MYTNGEVKGVLSYYMALDTDHAGSLAHCKAIDMRLHFRQLPQRLKQVLFLYGIMGLPSREAADRLEIGKDRLLELYDVGISWLTKGMNGE